MNFDWQQIVSLGIVGISAFLVVRGQIRSRRRAKLRGCGHDCGCSPASNWKDAKQNINKLKLK